MRLYILFVMLFTTAVQAASGAEEVYRIRVRNQAGGLVQVSVDGGTTYAAVGRVKVAANARIIGFAASSYIPHGTVAATAVHGLRIKTGQFTQGALGKAQMPLMFSLTPAEFWQIPKGYGGHIPRSSGILTDIYSGQSIFRNLSPFVGNQVFIEKGSRLQPIPEDYSPVVGDTYVIVVNWPEHIPSDVTFENRTGGSVTVTYPDGSSQVIAHVERPVMGVGRYDGTSLTGVGAVNTNHGGVLTLSTAPVCAPGSHEGGSVETRGGFMVQPYYHVKEQGEGAVQVMVISPKDKSKPVLEGTPPLFSGNINLSYYKDHPECSYRVEVKIDDGNWEPVPQIVGKVNDAFTPAYLNAHFAKLGQERAITRGVTAIRLLFPTYNAAVIASELKKDASAYTARAITAGTKPQKGTINITPTRRLTGIVSFSVDGRTTYTTSNSPYTMLWDSTRVSNGFHSIEVVDDSGEVVESRQVLVKN